MPTESTLSPGVEPELTIPAICMSRCSLITICLTPSRTAARSPFAVVTATSLCAAMMAAALLSKTNISQALWSSRRMRMRLSAGSGVFGSGAIKASATISLSHCADGDPYGSAAAVKIVLDSKFMASTPPVAVRRRGKCHTLRVHTLATCSNSCQTKTTSTHQHRQSDTSFIDMPSSREMPSPFRRYIS